MSDSKKRILTAVGMALIAGGAVVGECFGLPAVQWLTVAVAGGMVAEFMWALWGSKGARAQGAKGAMGQGCKDKITGSPRCARDDKEKFASSDKIIFAMFFLWLILMVVAAWFVGSRPWVMLLMLLIISAADIGAWFFGKLFGGDKMWERLSPKKTWSGQIAGIACGTFAAVMYGLLGTDTFLPQLMWIGISVSLLSQYGDLTESWIKRKLGIKDMSNLLPGHGGILDRFDGWIYVLPIIWLVMI